MYSPSRAWLVLHIRVAPGGQLAHVLHPIVWVPAGAEGVHDVCHSWGIWSAHARMYETSQGSVHL